MQDVRKTAKIYQFPARVRAAVSVGARDIEGGAQALSARAPMIMWGAGWHHEAAVQEARQSGKR